MAKNKYPVYIISKGRWEKPLTARIFEAAGVDYLIAVEPQEYDNYVAALGAHRVLVLPFANLGLGSYPARNYCWEHAIARGYDRHWLFDDNILRFRKIISRRRVLWDDIATALAYVERGAEAADIAGFEEYNFVINLPKQPFKINTHVYSAMLIRNALPYRWRLKYNEDVDLCLQVLHNGGTTMSCVYYMADKVSTAVKMKGGNQTELYAGNAPVKNLLKAKMLQAVWPQYVRVVFKFGRHHHQINWNVFKPKSA